MSGLGLLVLLDTPEQKAEALRVGLGLEVPDRLAWVRVGDAIAQNGAHCKLPSSGRLGQKTAGRLLGTWVLGAFSPPLSPEGDCSTCLVRGVDVCLAVAVGCVFLASACLSAAP